MRRPVTYAMLPLWPDYYGRLRGLLTHHTFAVSYSFAMRASRWPFTRSSTTFSRADYREPAPSSSAMRDFIVGMCNHRSPAPAARMSQT